MVEIGEADRTVQELHTLAFTPLGNSVEECLENNKDVAKNPNGGMAGAGIGLGAGVAMGKMFVDSMQSQQAPTQSVGATKNCPTCNAQVSVNAKFCSECGTKLNTKKFCANCGAEINGSAKFCPSCGQKL